METKANHVLIGAATLAMLAAALAFVLWLARTEIDRDVQLYDIHFEGPISGLSSAGDVRFNGIKVGQVQDIGFHRDRPETVRVRVEVATNTPIRADSIATLEIQGVTGVSFVQITGGSLESAMLQPTPERPIPEIQAGRSAISEVFATAPELLSRAVVLVDEVTRLVGGENREQMSRILDNVEQFSGLLANRDQEVEDLIRSADVLLQELRDTSRSVGTLAAGFTDLAVTADGAMESADTVIKNDLRALVSESRQLVQSLDRFVQRVESDPARFLFGSRSEGYRAQ